MSVTMRIKHGATISRRIIDLVLPTGMDWQATAQIRQAGNATDKWAVDVELTEQEDNPGVWDATYAVDSVVTGTFPRPTEPSGTVHLYSDLKCFVEGSPDIVIKQPTFLIIVEWDVTR